MKASESKKYKGDVSLETRGGDDTGKTVVKVTSVADTAAFFIASNCGGNNYSFQKW